MAARRACTEVISGASAVAVEAKLTIPMRLPPPIWPSCTPSVASSRMSTKVLAAFLRLSRGLPAMLPERSRSSTTSMGLETRSGSAVRARVTWKVPPQRIVAVSGVWRRG